MCSDAAGDAAVLRLLERADDGFEELSVCVRHGACGGGNLETLRGNVVLCFDLVVASFSNLLGKQRDKTAEPLVFGLCGRSQIGSG